VLQRTEGSAEPYTLPVEVDLADQRAFQLSQTGFAPLVSRRDTDVAYFNLVPSFHKPKRYDDEEATRASFLAATLPYRGFAGAVAHELDRIGRRIGGGLSAAEISDSLRQSLRGLLSPMEDGESADDSIHVEVDNNPDEPSLLDVTVRVRPGFQIYGGAVDLVVGTSVPR
jgi:type VI secretion system protein ImpC